MSALGFVSCAVSVFGFGTNFLPVKATKMGAFCILPTVIEAAFRFESARVPRWLALAVGDGMFFQFVMCVTIWLCGLIVQLVRVSAFEPFAMLGGAIWATGNCACALIVQFIGIGFVPAHHRPCSIAHSSFVRMS
jgi:hypothetical protein